MIRSFGSCAAGDITAVTITDGKGISAEILSLGATLRSLFVPGRDGKATDVVLGYETAEDYMKGDYFGATVGRYANRITGASFSLNGTEYKLPANEGRHQLHGGPGGFSFRNWTVIPYENKAVFRLVSPHMDQGFPGEMQAEVVYSLETPGELAISYEAVCDRDTVVNLTNHAYFNLAGHDSGRVDGHLLTVLADRYTPVDDDLIPSGEILPVNGSDFDLRRPVRLEEIFRRPALQATAGLDHNFVLNGETAAVLFSPETGISLEILTDQPGLQVYTSGALKECRGKNGAVYGQNHAVCLETQHFPDSVHQPAFPSVVLKAGEIFRSRTVCRFAGR